MRRSSGYMALAASGVLIAAGVAPGAASAQEPLLDAGNQAMIMHQGDLLEQQTAPNNAHTNDRRAHDRSPAGCSIAEQREKLRPEFERRVRTEGQQAATAWLQQQAAELGRGAGQRVKAGGSC